ncbi:MAG: hypothetical protein U1E25_08720 [Methylocystis sp.]
MITARSPPANGSSIGESARRPAFQGMPWKAGRHENWRIFNRHFWGVYVRHSHLHERSRRKPLLKNPVVPDTEATVHTDPAEAFRAAIRARLGREPRRIVGDGVMHGFPTKNGRDEAGWFVFYDDEFPAGSFGGWRSGATFKWLGYDRTLAPDDRERLRVVQAEREK